MAIDQRVLAAMASQQTGNMDPRFLAMMQQQTMLAHATLALEAAKFVLSNSIGFHVDQQRHAHGVIVKYMLLLDTIKAPEEAKKDE